MRRETLCFSIYSLMSSWISASSSPNRKSARVFASRVLPTPVGPANRKMPVGRLGVLQAAAGPADRLGDLLDGFFLGDDGLVQLVLHGEQADGVFGTQPGQRDAGHLATTSAITSSSTVPSVCWDCSFQSSVAASFFSLTLSALFPQGGGLLEVLVGDGLLLGRVQLLDLGVEVLQVRRADHGFEADAGPGLVDHVDRLVRQGPLGDVAGAELDGGGEGRVRDLDAVVFLVAVPQALQDFEPPGRGWAARR